MEEKVTHKQKHWIKLFKKFENSGLGQKEFCYRNKIKPSTFSSIKTQMRRKGLLDGPRQAEDMFIPLKKKNPIPTSISIFLDNGQEISFASPPPVGWFISLMNELGKENVKH